MLPIVFPHEASDMSLDLATIKATLNQRQKYRLNDVVLSWKMVT